MTFFSFYHSKADTAHEWDQLMRRYLQSFVGIFPQSKWECKKKRKSKWVRKNENVAGSFFFETKNAWMSSYNNERHCTGLLMVDGSMCLSFSAKKKQFTITNEKKTRFDFIFRWWGLLWPKNIFPKSMTFYHDIVLFVPLVGKHSEITHSCIKSFRSTSCVYRQVEANYKQNKTFLNSTVKKKCLLLCFLSFCVWHVLFLWISNNLFNMEKEYWPYSMVFPLKCATFDVVFMLPCFKP